MYSAWNPFIGYMFAAYIILSIASAQFLFTYAVYKILNKIIYKIKLNKIINEIEKQKRKQQHDKQRSD